MSTINETMSSSALESAFLDAHGQSPLKVWDLNENSTAYDDLIAAPSDEALHGYWSAWAAIALGVGTISFIVFLGIVTNKKTRQKPFNLYLLYLTVPDFVFSLICGVTCASHARLRCKPTALLFHERTGSGY